MGYHSRLKYLINNQANAAKYKAWDDMDKAQRQAAYATAASQGGIRVPVNRVPGYLIPMQAGPEQKVVGGYPIFGDNPGHAISTALKGVLQPKYQKVTIPTDLLPSKSKGVKKPCIVRFTEKDATANPRTSRILGTSYKAKNTNSASGGAGKDAITQTILDFTSDIYAAAAAWQNAGDNRKAKIIPEIDFIL